MKYIISSLCLALSFILCAQDNQQQIFFATASAHLDTTAQEQLNEIVAHVHTLGDYRIKLAAHTDSRGTVTYNQQLAQDRAQAISQYLAQQGIFTDQLEVHSFGESQSGNDYNSASKQQRNRRVDISIQAWNWSNLSLFRDSLGQGLTQHFSVDAQKDILIEGDKGGRFFIAANSLVDAQGQAASGLVDIELIECYSIGDMISMNLNTTAQGKVLESGGMYSLKASAQGQELSLKKGSELAAAIPSPEIVNGMSLFNGVDHDDELNQVDWVNTQNNVGPNFPRLKLAKGPPRPAQVFIAPDLSKLTEEEIDELIGFSRPIKPNIKPPNGPREPNYDNVSYGVRGIKRLFVSKKVIDQKIADKKARLKENYDKRVAKYQAQQTHFDTSMQIYNAAVEVYEDKRSEAIDEYGQIVRESGLFKHLEQKYAEEYQVAYLKYQKDSTAYAAYKDRKIALYQKQVEALDNIDQAGLQQYFLVSNQLGWANIDRFLKDDLPTTYLAALSEASKQEAMVYIAFPERNIILNMKAYEKGHYINPIPMNETAQLIAIKVENNKAMLAQQTLTISEAMEVELSYKNSRLSDIRELLANM